MGHEDRDYVAPLGFDSFCTNRRQISLLAGLSLVVVGGGGGGCESQITSVNLGGCGWLTQVLCPPLSCSRFCETILPLQWVLDQFDVGLDLLQWI